MCEEGAGVCATLMTIISLLIILASLPFSLFFVVKVVQEYERAVIFRLGRLLSGGASGPGVFFVIPCMDIYVKIDMRTSTYEIPPQEVGVENLGCKIIPYLSDSDQGLCDSVRQCHHVLQG